MPERSTAVLGLFGAVVLAVGGILWLGQPHRVEPGTTYPPWYPMANEAGDPAFAGFANHIPCTDAYTAVDECDRMKFGIVFYRDAAGAPATYLMSRIYVGVGDDRTVNMGTWSIVDGIAQDPGATVYRLDSGAPSDFDMFWAVGDDILFILDTDLNPRVGDAAYGYALNRVALGQTFTVPPDD